MGIRGQKISVNISGMHFRQGRILSTLKSVFNEIKIPSECLEIEITEEDTEEVILILKELQSMGISIAVDDFGTGYSSLSYLKRLPVDRVKIDRSFISNLTSNSSDKAIVKTIITMAKLLNLKVAAEGVETKGQLELLCVEECHEVQGHYFTRPMPSEKYENFLKNYS